MIVKKLCLVVKKWFEKMSACMYVVFVVVFTEIDINLLDFFIETFKKFYILDFTKIKPLYRF